MSDPLVARLKRFTPAGLGLDRDVLLFEAGRASARPGRGWPALAAVLALGQVLTLLLLGTTPTAPLPPTTRTHEQTERSAPTSPAEEDSPWARHWRQIERGGESTTSPSGEALVPDAPPLHVLTSLQELPVD